MGYNFIVSSVNAAMSQTPDMVDVDVTVTQIGVAPFYYPLSLVLDCSALVWPRAYEGVEEIISEGESKLFSFVGISATPDCLGNVSLYLSCPTAYIERPIKFAQGTDGRVSLSIPFPEIYASTSSTERGSTRIVVSVAAVMVVLCLMLAAAIVVARRRKLRSQCNRKEKSARGESEETYNEDLDLDTAPPIPVLKYLRTLSTFDSSYCR